MIFTCQIIAGMLEVSMYFAIVPQRCTRHRTTCARPMAGEARVRPSSDIQCCSLSSSIIIVLRVHSSPFFIKFIVHDFLNSISCSYSSPSFAHFYFYQNYHPLFSIMFSTNLITPHCFDQVLYDKFTSFSSGKML